MQDPNNPSSDWQQVPHTPGTPTDPPVSNVPPSAYPPPPGAYTPPVYEQPPLAAQPVGLSANAAAALSYLTFIPAVIFLLLEPYKRVPFIRFHAIQCIALSVVYFVVSVIMGVIGAAAFLSTPGGSFGTWGLFALLFWCVRVVFFIVWVIAIYNASQGKWFKIPVIGDFALKQAQQ